MVRRVHVIVRRIALYYSAAGNPQGMQYPIGLFPNIIMHAIALRRAAVHAAAQRARRAGRRPRERPTETPR